VGRFTEPALVIGNQRRVDLLELEGEQAVKAILKTDSAAELVAPLRHGPEPVRETP
jgi:hypothetical protein